PGAEKRIGILAGKGCLERGYRGIDVPKRSVRESPTEMRRGLGGVASKRDIVIQQPDRALGLAGHDLPCLNLQEARFAFSPPRPGEERRLTIGVPRFVLAPVKSPHGPAPVPGSSAGYTISDRGATPRSARLPVRCRRCEH